MAIVESLGMGKRLCRCSMEREVHISRKIVQEVLKIPKALMERFTKWTDLNSLLSSDRRGAYLFFLIILTVAIIVIIIIVISHVNYVFNKISSIIIRTKYYIFCSRNKP